jgi:hypothetical protein
MRAYLCLLALGLLALAGVLGAADKVQTETIRGKLIVHQGKAPTIETPEHKLIAVDGDAPTHKVLNDVRVNGFQVEARGHFTAPDRFLINPQHTHPMLVRQDGKLKMITYWCDVCSIRAYAPGPCVCCQRETTLELRDPDDIR